MPAKCPSRSGVSCFWAGVFDYFLLVFAGAGPLMMASGAVFGVWKGVIIVSFISAVGATLAMLIARTLLRDWAQEKFSHLLATANYGIEQEGALYLFGLRLIPPMPYFIVNLVFGLTEMRVLTYYLATQFGMLPLIIVYANAGASVSNVQSLNLQNVFTTQVVVSLTLLVTFPFIAKRGLAFYKSHFMGKE